jgi:hypothetical protein
MAVTLNLNDLANAADQAITPSETDLASSIASLGADTTAAEMLQIQAKLAINSTMTASFSAVLKERGDTLKGVSQKIG